MGQEQPASPFGWMVCRAFSRPLPALVPLKFSLPRATKLARVSLSIGIVGLPNVGKSTLFNALTRASALASNYPFATIEPNVGVVGVPDPRLAELAKLYDSARMVQASVRFTDIAGLVRGASQGQGLGNQFLAHIRETDAICQVVRVFADPDVTHVDGDVSPERDIETVVTELILADLQTLEKAVPRLAKETKFAKDPEKVRTAEAAAAAQQLLDAGTPLSAGAAAAGIDMAALRELQLLTAKPFLYVFNMDTSELADEDLRKRLSALVAPAEAIFLDAKTEADLAELGADEGSGRTARRGRAGRARPGPAGARRVPRAGPADIPHRRPRRPGPGRSRPGRPPRRRPSSTPTSSAVSSRPRWSPTTTSSRPCCPPPAPRARPASKARTTLCAMATSLSSAFKQHQAAKPRTEQEPRRSSPMVRSSTPPDDLLYLRGDAVCQCFQCGEGRQQRGDLLGVASSCTTLVGR